MPLVVDLLPAHIPDINGVFFLQVIISFQFDKLVAFLYVQLPRILMHIKNELVVNLNVI